VYEAILFASLVQYLLFQQFDRPGLEQLPSENSLSVDQAMLIVSSRLYPLLKHSSIVASFMLAITF
jgi:hypothetical protein